MEWFESEDFWRDCYPYMFSAERFAAAKDEVSRIVALTQRAQGNVLDLCCGPGRHAVEFALRGFQVTGVDRTPFLLGRAQEHASQAGAAVDWVMEDMRRFVRPDAFDLACSLFTSFGYFKDQQDDLVVLRNIHRNLKETGVLVMELLGKERLARVWQNTISTELAEGSLLIQRHQLRDDWSRIYTEWILLKDGHVRSFSLEHTIYSGRELKERLLSCGFKRVQLFGDLGGSPYNQEAARLVAVAWKSAA